MKFTLKKRNIAENTIKKCGSQNAYLPQGDSAIDCTPRNERTRREKTKEEKKMPKTRYKRLWTIMDIYQKAPLLYMDCTPKKERKRKARRKKTEMSAQFLF